MSREEPLDEDLCSTHCVDLERQHKEKTMGRPVNKRNLGATGVDATPAIPIRFHDGSNLIEGKILSQRGTNKFNCSNDGDTITRICRLTSDGSSPNADLECQIIGIAAGGNPIAIKKIFNRTAVDYNNNRYTWTAEDDSTESLLRLTAI
jgi:hypothetical protein